MLYDIELLTHPPATPETLGKRVAAFGYYAGFAGAAIALLAWAHPADQPDGSSSLGRITLHNLSWRKLSGKRPSMRYP